jgi:serine protease Do
MGRVRRPMGARRTTDVGDTHHTGEPEHMTEWTTQRRWGRYAAAVAGLTLLAACGGGGGKDEASNTTRTQTANTESKGESSSDRGSVSTLDGVQSATIQVVAKGTFRDPEVGYADGSGAGSGFLISPDGLAVTNNHVVTGAGTLQVYVGGDTGKSYNASVVGVSECNDLAVIKLAGVKDVPFLSWYDGAINPGLSVHAAGFPLGDPQYTLTNGSVTKAKAGGDITGTSSIDHTIEHDANIEHGNSGGPLVSESGKVVGVNYAGLNQDVAPQFYAIASDLAQPVVEKLKKGDFESLGINGWAVSDDASGITGVWVAGVAAGSPASKADILPGDIVTAMNGVPVGTDGTFKDYCDVIRTAGSKPISVEVLRYDTQEVLRGEINGAQPLKQAFSFKQQVEDDVDVTKSSSAQYSYHEVRDDTGQILVEVPTAWSDVDTSSFALHDGTSVPYIGASTNLDKLENSYTVSGMEFALFGPVDDLDQTLSLFSFSGDCKNQGIQDYDDGAFTGRYQVWSDCNGSKTAVVVLTAVPSDDSYTAVIVVQATSDADLQALDHIFATFDVVN